MAINLDNDYARGLVVVRVKPHNKEDGLCAVILRADLLMESTVHCLAREAEDMVLQSYDVATAQFHSIRYL